MKTHSNMPLVPWLALTGLVLFGLTGCRTFNYTEADLERERRQLREGLNYHYGDRTLADRPGQSSPGGRYRDLRDNAGRYDLPPTTTYRGLY